MILIIIRSDGSEVACDHVDIKLLAGIYTKRMFVAAPATMPIKFLTDISTKLMEVGAPATTP